MPSRCSALGPCSRLATSWAVGSKGASSGAASATRTTAGDDDEAGERRPVGHELARETAAAEGDRARREALRLRRELGGRLHHAATGRCVDSAMRGSSRW